MRKIVYKIQYTYSSRNDIKNMKNYILDTFKYRELGENFTQKMKVAVKSLRVMPAGYDTTGFQYRGYDIYLRTYRTYLFFYTVDEMKHTVSILRVLQDGMNWQYIIKR